SENQKLRLVSELDRYKPDVVAVPGWSEPLALYTLFYCYRRGVPVLMMSESRVEDAPRFFARETLKRQVMRLCSVALVGGRAHVAYLDQLGFEARRIFTGYDAVDNEYFATGADAAREKENDVRQALDLPRRFFLSCARLVEKKNLLMLIEA